MLYENIIHQMKSISIVELYHLNSLTKNVPPEQFIAAGENLSLIFERDKAFQIAVLKDINRFEIIRGDESIYENMYILYPNDTVFKKDLSLLKREASRHNQKEMAYAVYNGNTEEEYAQLLENAKNCWNHEYVQIDIEFMKKKLSSIYPIKQSDILRLKNHPELIPLVEYLSYFEVHLFLNELSEDAAESLEDLKTLEGAMIGKKSSFFLSLLRYFLSEGLNRASIKSTIYKIPTVTTKELQSATNDIIGYCNFVTNGKYKKEIEMWQSVYLHRNHIDLLVYCLLKRKTAFLKLVAQNPQYLAENSFNLLVTHIYKDYLNVNSLTINDIDDMKTKHFATINALTLNPGIYTYNELALLLYGDSEESEKKIAFYKELDGRVDDKLLLIKQAEKAGLFCSKSIELIQKCGKLLNEMSFSQYKVQYGQIEGLQNSDIIKILKTDCPEHFILDCKNIRDLRFVLKNYKKFTEEGNLDFQKGAYLTVDMDSKKVIKWFDFNETFKEQHGKEIRDFCVSGNAEIINAYLTSASLTSMQEENLKLIAKAEIAGKLKDLKYNGKDIQKEINMDVPEHVIEKWKENISYENNYEIIEKDDFETIMNIGVVPTRTCMHYKEGSYKECLLANFDTNKKIVHAEKDGMIYARAILRLTKGCKKRVSLKFIDIEHEETENIAEELVLFLEKPYVAHLNDKEKKKAIQDIYQFAKKKAAELGVKLMISSLYNEYLGSKLQQSSYYLYISKSKNGNQYLDSLGGKNTMDNEEKYKQINVIL